MSCAMRLVGCGWLTVRRAAVFCAAGIAALTTFGGPAEAATNSWSAVGPFGGQVRRLAIDPKNPANLYAVSQVGGVFKTVNAGKTWKRITNGMTDPFTYFDIAIDPSSPAILYVGDPAGLYKSKNGGKSWTKLPQGAGLYAFIVDPHASNTLYATNGSFVETSGDGGATWTQVGSGLPSGGQISEIAIDPVKSNTLYAATTKGVYKSVNSGASWTPSSAGMASNVTIFHVRIDPTNTNRLYATGNSNGTVAIYESTNGGAHWAAFPSKGLTLGIADFRIDPKTPSTLYVALGLGYGQNGVYVNKKRAATWKAINTGLDVPENSINQLAIDPKTPAKLYAATENGMFATANSGARWTAANNGLANTRTTVVAIGTDSKTIFAGTVANGLFKSGNRGASWIRINNGLAPGGGQLPLALSIAIDPGNAKHVLAGFEFASPSNLLQSTNGGASWTSVTDLNFQGRVFSIAFDPKNTKAILAGTAAGAFQSTDGGVHWKLLNRKKNALRLPPGPVRYVQFALVHGTTAKALGVDPANPIVEPIVSFVLEKAAEKGFEWLSSNWEKLDEPLSKLPEDNYIPSDMESGFWEGANGAQALMNAGVASASKIYATTIAVPYKKRVSSGTAPAIQNNRWTPWAVPKGIDPFTCAPVTSFAQDPKAPTVLFAGGNYGCGVLEGAKLGRSVTPLNTGLPYQSLAVNALATSADGCDMFAGTEGGSVYRFTFKRKGC
jgi:photosystem II stability/assembly factor-like uncharacterized protein